MTRTGRAARCAGGAGLGEARGLSRRRAGVGPGREHRLARATVRRGLAELGRADRLVRETGRDALARVLDETARLRCTARVGPPGTGRALRVLPGAGRALLGLAGTGRALRRLPGAGRALLGLAGIGAVRGTARPPAERRLRAAGLLAARRRQGTGRLRAAG
ncbi:hypothetical protein, partial [Pseudonocardia kongjuensis]|uniref:hypothetical protein n=1 Tax=Pseudonocardia kongjuensis TaxID=102227 RepID=UPI0031D1DC7A